jgi:hypothetical protein
VKLGTCRISEIALKAVQKQFDDAEKIAKSLSGEARQNARVKKATQSLTSLNQAGRRPPMSGLGGALGHLGGGTLPHVAWVLDIH